MILVIGGKYQGKMDFVKKNFNIYDKTIFDCNIKDLNNLTYHYETIDSDKFNVVCNLEEYVLKKTKEGLEPLDVLDDFLKINFSEKTLFVSCDISEGLVPIDKIMRIYRENIGKLLCYISEYADKVYHVLYGVSYRIK